MAKRLVFLFKQITVRYPRVTNSESGHDRFLFTRDFLVPLHKLSFKFKYFIKFFSGFTVLEFLPDFANVHNIIYFKFEVRPTKT